MHSLTFSTRREGATQFYRCDQTGIVYSIESAERLLVRNSGVFIGARSSYRDARKLMEQEAALDFRTAQGDCGAYSA